VKALNLLATDYRLGDMVARYVRDANGANNQLILLPANLASQTSLRRERIESAEALLLPAHFQPLPARSPDSLVQVKIRGEGEASARIAGRSMRNSPSTAGLIIFESPTQETTGDLTTIRTTLRSPAGWTVEHCLRWRVGDRALSVSAQLVNTTNAPITVEHLSSFSLGGLTPFTEGLGIGRLHFHRFRTAWAAEGRHERLSAEALHLEPAWAPFGPRSERFGQVGSAPCNGFFPWGAVEDSAVGVLWGAQLCHPGSWQMEFHRVGDEVNFSGGLADREFGHWWKLIQPGESFEPPTAWISVVHGPLDALCDRLTAMQRPAAEAQPAAERSLPIVFNEWCTSWGHPTYEAMLAVAKRLQGSPVAYCVVDDGWAERPPKATMQSNGDWIVDQKKFPGGLKPAFDGLRQRGFVPGVWFEFEACNPGAQAWKETAHQLHRDRLILTVGTRRFWDFRDPWVHDYLAQKVITLLRDSGAGYLKVDYNDTIGFGADGAESPGEGLRQHLEGVQRFFTRLRTELPELVIENCSSGGHRLEPSMQGLCAMGSFSDAHESSDIPIIAANLHRLILPRQSQVWAVLHAGDSDQRLTYSLAATFLGRMCLSGEIHALSNVQWARVGEAMKFYQAAVPVIQDGASTIRQDELGSSWREPSGRQAVIRVSRNGAQALVVVHNFAAAPAVQLQLNLPEGARWKIARAFPSESDAKILAGGLHVPSSGNFTGRAWLLKR
jgi:alpha-galactosidase